MQQNAHRMMTAWVRAKKLDVCHMRDPCQRMPIRFHRRRERPLDVVPGKSLQDVYVGGHVCGVIIIHKAIAKSGDVKNEGADKQKKRNDQRGTQVN